MGDVEFYITVGLTLDGRPLEVFIKAGCIDPKVEDDFGFQGWCDTVAELCSIALQAGVPLETLCRHLRSKHFKPNGWAEEPGFGHVGSVPDYLGRWLMKEFEKHDNEAPIHIFKTWQLKSLPMGFGIYLRNG